MPVSHLQIKGKFDTCTMIVPQAFQQWECISSLSDKSTFFCPAVWENQTVHAILEKELINKSPPSVDVEEIGASQAVEFPSSSTFRKQYIEAQGSDLSHLHTYFLSTFRKIRKD